MTTPRREDTSSSASGNFGPPLGEQLLENGAVTAVLILAVAAEREAGLMRQGGQQVEDSGRLRLVHLGPELALERVPGPLVLRPLPERHQLLAGREIRQPDVIEVERCELRLRHSPRWSANRAEPQTLIGLSR